MEFGILIPGIPPHEKSQKKCGLSVLHTHDMHGNSSDETCFLQPAQQIIFLAFINIKHMTNKSPCEIGQHPLKNMNVMYCDVW